MPEKPTLRTLWQIVLSVDAVARLIQVRCDDVEQDLKTAEGQARVRQRLAQRLSVSADRLGPIRPRGVVAGDVWLEVPVTVGWVAASRLAVQAGRLVVAEVRVFPDEETALRREDPAGRWSGEILGVQAEVPQGGLTARTLRAVRLGEHPRHVREIVRWFASKYGLDAFKPGGSLAALGLAPEGERPRPSRQFGQPDSFYAELARDYVRLIERGLEKPVATVARARGKDVKLIRGWLHEARVRGLLTPGIQGRSGGQLTMRAERLLRDADRAKTSATRREGVRRERPRTKRRQRGATAKPTNRRK